MKLGLRIGATVLGVACCAVAVLLGAMLQWVQERESDSPPLPADCVVVLGAAVWPGEQPSPALRARTLLGAELYSQGLARYLVLTGGTGAHPPAEAEVMRRLALSAGVPAEAIIVEDQATSTEENARYVATLAKPHGWLSVIVVSDPFHLARSAYLFQDAGFSVQCVGTDDVYYTPETRAYHQVREAVGLAWHSLVHPFRHPFTPLPGLASDDS